MHSPSRGRGFERGRLSAHPYGLWLREKVLCIENGKPAGPEFQSPIHFIATPLTKPLASDIQQHRRRYHAQSRHDLSDQHGHWGLGRGVPPSSIVEPSRLDQSRPSEVPAAEPSQSCSEREKFFQDLDAERQRVGAIMHDYAHNRKHRRKEGLNKVRLGAGRPRSSYRNERDCCGQLRRALFLEERRRLSVEKQLQAQSQARIIAEARARQEASWRLKIEERLESQRRLKENAEKARMIAELQIEEETRTRRIVELESRAYANMQTRLRAECDEIARLEMEARIKTVLEAQKRKEAERLLEQFLKSTPL